MTENEAHDSLMANHVSMIRDRYHSRLSCVVMSGSKQRSEILDQMKCKHHDTNLVLSPPIFFNNQQDDTESEGNSADDNEMKNISIGERDDFSDESDQVQKEGFVENAKEKPYMFPKYDIFLVTLLCLKRELNYVSNIKLKINIIEITRI